MRRRRRRRRKRRRREEEVSWYTVIYTHYIFDRAWENRLLISDFKIMVPRIVVLISRAKQALQHCCSTYFASFSVTIQSRAPRMKDSLAFFVGFLGCAESVCSENE